MNYAGKTSISRRVRDGEVELVMPTGLVFSVLSESERTVRAAEGRTILVGRDPRCDLVLSDTRVSGVHCEILLSTDAESVRIRDLESSNGTILDGERVKGLRDVAYGAPIRIGRLTVRAEEYRHGSEAVLAGAPEFGGFFGRGARLQSLYARLIHAADGPMPILLLGEKSTGRRLLGRELHARSQATGAFVEVTPDASQDIGELLERASSGTLYLDGWPPRAWQLRLLDAHEDGAIRLVVADSPVAAARANLPSESERPDPRFFWALLSNRFLIPPLRERKFIYGFIRRQVDLLRGDSEVTKNAIEQLAQEPWPGNVGELHEFLRALFLRQPRLVTEQTVKRALSLPSDEEVLSAVAQTENKQQAADMAGCSRAHVGRVLKRNGVC